MSSWEVAHMPEALWAAYERWDSAGRPAQAPSEWKRESWARRFPDFSGLFGRLDGVALNRQTAIKHAPVVDSEPTAVEAFLIAMMWGYGNVGFGPYRTRRVLTRDETEELTPEGGPVAKDLLEVARKARGEGGLSAFSDVAQKRNEDAGYLKWLGPAFGSKYIYIVTAKHSPEILTPVMDSVVRDWFKRNVPGRRLKLDNWDTESYEYYVESLKTWATEIRERSGRDVRIDEVEYLIFTGDAEDDGESRQSRAAEAAELPLPDLFDQLRDRAATALYGDAAGSIIDGLELLLNPDIASSPEQRAYAEGLGADPR